jgi:hypothetical protein
VTNPKARRIEIRFPDPMNSGYLVFSALLMAGLDGIINRIDPGAPSDKDLYDLPPEEEKNIPQVCSSLDQALAALDKDRDFLKAGGVFSDDFIDAHRPEDGRGHPLPCRHPSLEYQMLRDRARPGMGARRHPADRWWRSACAIHRRGHEIDYRHRATVQAR